MEWDLYCTWTLRKSFDATVPQVRHICLFFSVRARSACTGAHLYIQHAGRQSIKARPCPVGGTKLSPRNWPARSTCTGVSFAVPCKSGLRPRRMACFGLQAILSGRFGIGQKIKVACAHCMSCRALGLNFMWQIHYYMCPAGT
ncbi:hypothetical protein DFH09DRAFT_1362705 [Mycena vulgaris]|nr:hypothetical protein DFH09DRAFT_1362705 [Mycena vulgaris]